MNGPKPGYETSEFWIAIFMAVIGGLASIGILTPAQANEAAQAATSIAGLIVAVISVVVYIHSRTQVKTAAYETTAKVQTARAVAGAHQAPPVAPQSPTAPLVQQSYTQNPEPPDSPPSPQYGPIGTRPAIRVPSVVGLVDPATTNTAPSV